MRLQGEHGRCTGGAWRLAHWCEVCVCGACRMHCSPAATAVRATQLSQCPFAPPTHPPARPPKPPARPPAHAPGLRNQRLMVASPASKAATKTQSPCATRLSTMQARLASAKQRREQALGCQARELPMEPVTKGWGGGMGKSTRAMQFQSRVQREERHACPPHDHCCGGSNATP